MQPSPRFVMACICAFVIVEVTLGVIFPSAAWWYVRWVGGLGVVTACVLISHLSRGR